MNGFTKKQSAYFAVCKVVEDPFAYNNFHLAVFLYLGG